MKIALGCDHGGFELKEDLKNFLIEQGYEVIDYCLLYTSSLIGIG